MTHDDEVLRNSLALRPRATMQSPTSADRRYASSLDSGSDPHYEELSRETILEWDSPRLKFGCNAVRDVGFELGRLGATDVFIVTDAHLVGIGTLDGIMAALRRYDLHGVTYSGVVLEPTARSIEVALKWIEGIKYDAILAVGGGSSLDTAKAINLYSTYPAEVLHYVPRPIGKGLRVPGPLKPLLAIPTTSGTGSESTPVCVLDLEVLHVKVGISDPQLRPTLAIVDPLLTLTMPPSVTAATGYDVMVQSIEAWTSRPSDQRPGMGPEARPSFNVGSNVLSDLFAEKALSLVGTYLTRAVIDGLDVEARIGMSQAAMLSRLSNAGDTYPTRLRILLLALLKDTTQRDIRCSYAQCRMACQSLRPQLRRLHLLLAQAPNVMCALARSWVRMWDWRRQSSG